MFFVKMTDDEIAEVDPVTMQYPFLVAANGETSDLSTIYFLLSKNPSLLGGTESKLLGKWVNGKRNGNNVTE